MRILVTGGNGFIGRQCVPHLVKDDTEVHVASRTGRSELARVTSHRLNLYDRAATQLLIDKLRPTHLVHLAWVTSPGIYWESSENDSWVEVSMDLARIFADRGGQRIVVAGTCAEYQVGGTESFDEVKTPIAPRTRYGKSKAKLFDELSLFCDRSRISLGWARIFHLFGPFEDSLRLVPSIIVPLLKGQRAKAPVGGHWRDFSAVEDIGGAMAKLLLSDFVGPANVASGLPIQVKDLVKRIGFHLNALERIDFGELASRPNEPEYLCANIDRLRSEVGWIPSVSLDKGLEGTIAWWRQQF